ACPAVCTAPACAAKPHGYPSYIPLRLTVGFDKGKVNGKPIGAVTAVTDRKHIKQVSKCCSNHARHGDQSRCDSPEAGQIDVGNRTSVLQRKPTLRETASRAPARLMVTGREGSRVTTALAFCKWPVRAIPSPTKVGFRSQTSCHIFGPSSSWGGLLGRPVVLRVRGAFLVCSKVFRRTQVPKL